MSTANRQPEQAGWLSSFLKELVSMPKRHMIVFLITTILLVLLEVEITKGWHLVHLLEVVGAMLLLYLAWAAWRSSRENGSSHTL